MNKFNKNFLSLIFVLAISFVAISPFLTFAQDDKTPPPDDQTTTTNNNTQIKVNLQNPLKVSSVKEVINFIIDLATKIGSIIAVLMIMWGGFLFVTAGGDTKQRERAKDTILYAIIGAVILLGAYVISEAIQNTISKIKS